MKLERPSWLDNKEELAKVIEVYSDHVTEWFMNPRGFLKPRHRNNPHVAGQKAKLSDNQESDWDASIGMEQD